MSTGPGGLWTCPDCGRAFANARQQHSCGRWSESDFLAGRSPAALALYRRFCGLVDACGPVTRAPAKSRVGFQVRMIFAAVDALAADHMDIHLVLARRLESARFRKVESISPRNHVHHLRIREPAELDEELATWLREAYRVGQQQHLH